MDLRVRLLEQWSWDTTFSKMPWNGLGDGPTVVVTAAGSEDGVVDEGRGSGE